jgi:hypothetical protein
VQRRMKTRYDVHRRSPKFKEGQLVLYKQNKKPKKGRSKKLSVQWGGPYKIVKMQPPVNVIIKKKRGRHKTQTVHVDHLKPYRARLREDALVQEGGGCYGSHPGYGWRRAYVEVPRVSHRAKRTFVSKI